MTWRGFEDTPFTTTYCIQFVRQSRAVGAGPAGPAAAGPIFGQTNPRKNAVRASAGCSIITTLAGIHKLSVGAGGKHALSLEESRRQGVSFGKLRSQ